MHFQFGNLCTIYITSNSIFHSHTKGIGLDYHLIGKRILIRAHRVQFIHLMIKIANIFLHKSQFHCFVEDQKLTSFLMLKLVEERLQSLNFFDLKQKRGPRAYCRAAVSSISVGVAAKGESHPPLTRSACKITLREVVVAK